MSNLKYLKLVKVLLEASKIDPKQLKVGTKVEREHKGTVAKIKKSIKNGKLTISDTEIFKSIASDHIREFDKYYDALSKMEKSLKKN